MLESTTLTEVFVIILRYVGVRDIETFFNGFMCLNSFNANNPTKDGYHLRRNSYSDVKLNTKN